VPQLNLTPRPDRTERYDQSKPYRPGASMTDSNHPAPPSTRPLGVGLAAVASLCLGIFLLLVFVLAILQPSLGDSTPYLIIFPALLAIGLTPALWQLYPWARILAIIFYSLLAVIALVSAFNSPITLSGFTSVVAPALLVIYLCGKHARAAFTPEAVG
jgi:hypothetical protein